jgi:hypothetical protein
MQSSISITVFKELVCNSKLYYFYSVEYTPLIYPRERERERGRDVTSSLMESKNVSIRPTHKNEEKIITQPPNHQTNTHKRVRTKIQKSAKGTVSRQSLRTTKKPRSREQDHTCGEGRGERERGEGRGERGEGRGRGRKVTWRRRPRQPHPRRLLPRSPPPLLEHLPLINPSPQRT